MSLRDDTRGQAIQVGAVLLFAVLIVAFSTYQAVIIPEDNRRVEFNHNQEVQTQLADLRTAVLGAADSNSIRSVTVALGTTYPSRTLGLNPNPPAGSLRTVGATDPMVNLTVDNAVAAASDETADFWNGSARSYDTGLLRYSPIYNQYEEAPTTVYEHSVLYNRFPSSNALVLANQTLLDGDRLSIVTVNGSLDRTSSRSTAVDVRPMSRSDETVLVEATGSDPIVLRYASDLSVDRWRTILSDQPDVTVQAGSFSPPEGLTAIEVRLDPDRTYRLGMTKAGVGQGATGEPAAYLTDVAGDGATVQRGSSHDVTLAVRDRYNNPVPDVTVDSDVDGSKTTDADGEVTFTYDASGASTGTKRFNFTIEAATDPGGSTFDPDTPENVTATVTVSEGGSGGSGAYGLDWTNPSDEYENSGTDLTCDDGSCTWDVANSDDDTILLNAALDPPYEGIGLEFAVDDTNVGTLSTNSGTSDADGAATTELTAREDGVVNVVTSANDDSDTIEITIQNTTAGGGNDGPPSEINGIEYTGNLGTTGTNSGLQFDVRNVDDSSFARVEAIRIQSQITDADTLYDGQGREIEVTGGDADGYASDRTSAQNAYSADNSSISFSSNAVLSTSGSGRTATVTLRNFGTRPSPNANSFTQYDFSGLDRVAGSEQWDVAVTLRFQNRGDVTLFFREV